jgi:hypothetical protein
VEVKDGRHIEWRKKVEERVNLARYRAKAKVMEPPQTLS